MKALNHVLPEHPGARAEGPGVMASGRQIAEEWPIDNVFS